MSVAVKSGQVIAAQSGAASTTLSATLPAAPTAGNLLVFFMAGDKNTGALTLSGFTQARELLGTSVSLYVYYKVSDGTETTINPSWATSSAAGNTAYYLELEDTAVAGKSWEVAGTAETAYSDLTVNSRSSNTTAALKKAALAFGQWAIDSSVSWTSGSTYTNSYASQYEATGFGGRGAIFIAKLAVAGGATTESTFGYTGTADQVSGGVVAFAKVQVPRTSPYPQILAQ